MTKKLSSLFPDITKMSDEQLTDHIREIRRRKYIERAGSRVRAEKAAKPATNRKVKNVTKLSAELSPAQLARLISQLETDSGK